MTRGKKYTIATLVFYVLLAGLIAAVGSLFSFLQQYRGLTSFKGPAIISGSILAVFILMFVLSRWGLFSYLPLLCLLFLSCNGIANSIKHSVEEDVADAKDALRQEESKARAAYTTTYQSSIQHVSDHQLKIKLLLLDSTIAAGVKYMDSISGIMNLMPQDDPRNIEYLKNRFIYGGIGDTLFAVLNRVNDLARDVAQQTGHIAKVDSLRLTILNQPAADAWEQQDFSMLDPITAIVFN